MVLYDIFSVPIASTRESRSIEWSNLIQIIYRLRLTGKNQYSFAELNHLVLDGFLSAQSASYFLLGKASLKQIVLLDRFMEFRDMCMSQLFLSSSKILSLWQDKNDVEMENTFLFPLEELDSSVNAGLDFTSEIEQYNDCDLRELQKL